MINRGERLDSTDIARYFIKQKRVFGKNCLEVCNEIFSAERIEEEEDNLPFMIEYVINPPLSKRMENIISSLRKDKSFDLVIIDTPPLIGLSDALLVSEKSDGLILIVTTTQVPKNLPKECINKTQVSGTNLLGIISNSTNISKSEIVRDIKANGDKLLTLIAFEKIILK